MTKTIREYLKPVFILTGFSFLFLMLGNGVLSLTNPDEVFYTQTAKEMIRHHSWMTPYLFGAPQFEKPILTFWLLRLAFGFLGISSFSARFFPALFATAGILAVYFLGLLGFKDEKKAMLSAFILMSSALYIGLARTVFTDMFFSIFILLSLSSFFWAYTRREKRMVGVLLFFIFAGLAVLTKGPLGILIPLFIVFFFLGVKKDIRFFLNRDFLLGIFVFCLISLPWYIFMVKKYGTHFTYEFFYNDHLRRIIEAEHPSNDTWYFYPLATIGSMFPWSLYVVFSFIYLFKKLKKNASPIHLFLASWIIIVFLVFQQPHSKLVSYVFPLFPALALMAGDFIYDALSERKIRLLFFLTFTTWLFLFSIPIAMLVAGRRFSTYFNSPLPIFICVIILSFYLAFTVSFILKRKFLTPVYLISFVVPLLLYFSFLMHNNFESYVSSKNACTYLLKNYRVENPILCSKFFVRGVRYYTDKEVAVIDLRGKGFFSPHPIPFFDTDEKVRDFLHKQPVTYAILRKGYFKEVKRIAADDFKVDVLKIAGDEYILKIARGPFKS